MSEFCLTGLVFSVTAEMLLAKYLARVPQLGSRLGSRLVSARSVSSSSDQPETWKNCAAVLHGIDDLRFEEFPMPSEVSEGNVRIEMCAVGICGSDVKYWKQVSKSTSLGSSTKPLMDPMLSLSNQQPFMFIKPY